MLISPASESDFSLIMRMAKSFDLDCEDVSWKQFVTAKQDNSIVGFGRLRVYPDCTEIATLGVSPGQRKSGIGSALAKELIRLGPDEIFVSCVIPDFFSKLGFEIVKQYPVVLQKKVDFCKSYNFTDDQVFIMKLSKKA